MSKMEAQRVVVIQDASMEVSSNAIRWILHGFSLRAGDLLTLLAVIHQVNTPMGCTSRVDASSLIDVNQRTVETEAAKKREEYINSMELIQISKLYETHKVTFNIEFVAGPLPEVVALKAAEDIKATWVILDRQMKKHRKYFLEKLSCGVSRMKRNNIIKQFRGPISRKSAIEVVRKSHVSSNEMVPGTLEEGDLFSIEILVAEWKQAQELKQTSKDEKVSQVEDVKQISRIDKVSHVQELKQKQKSVCQGIEEVWQANVLQSSMCSICKNRRPDSEWEGDFTYVELVAATDDFSLRNTLSEGEVGFSFRGKLKNNLKIVVKKQKHSCSQMDIIEVEVHVLKKARHLNVVTLLGYCTEGSSMLLVYEYACNGSVNQHLSKYCPLPLTWTERMRVALGSARGLKYLHEKNIVHRSLRTSNILLNHDFEPMLGDFGLPGFMSDQSSEHKILDSLGFFAPEWSETRKFTFSTDVYSFGIVLLELISGKMPTEMLPGEKILLEWARPLLKERRHNEILDPRIIGAYDDQQLYWMCRLTQKCLSKDPKKRYKMDQVLSALEVVIDRKTRQVFEAISAVKMFHSRNRSNISSLPSNERTSREESFSINKDAKTWMGKSSSVSSSTSREISSSRISTSSRKSDQLLRSKSENGVPVIYSEMLNCSVFFYEMTCTQNGGGSASRYLKEH